MLVALPWPSPSLHSAQAAEGLDINTATGDQLVVLPGIGPAFAGRIIEGRPYKGTDELVQRMIIPQASYNTIKDQITAKQIAPTTGAPSSSPDLPSPPPQIKPQ
jgi:competence protein ComEA